MTTITTRKTAPTETKGEDIKARASSGEEITRPYPYRQGLDGVEAHEFIVRPLAEQIYPQGADLIIQRLPDRDTAVGYTFRVFERPTN